MLRKQCAVIAYFVGSIYLASLNANMKLNMKLNIKLKFKREYEIKQLGTHCS